MDHANFDYPCAYLGAGMTSDSSSSVPSRRNNWGWPDWVMLVVCPQILVASMIPLFCGCSTWLAYGSLWAIDFIAVWWLVAAACKHICPNNCTAISLPLRLTALVVFALMILASTFAYADIYLNSDVYHLVKDVGPNGEFPEASSNLDKLTDKIDACYFSLSTFTTLGYGDYIPASQEARLLVVWQLATSMLLLLCTLSVLTSRLATF